jgi:PST family polysaccharide transporter
MTEHDPHDAPLDDLPGTVRGSTRTVLIAQVASQGISLVTLAILMRMVGPENYGLLAMALPALMLPRMAATLGTGVATVQRPSLSSGQLNWLFWATLLGGALAAIATALLGPVLAWNYGQPILTPLCAALAGSTLVAAAGTQHQALLERKLRLLPLSRLKILAQGLGGLAGIVAAWRGAGVWALVVQQYGELLVLSAGLWLLEPWRPASPKRGEKLGDLFQLSSYYSLSTLVIYVAQNLDKILFPLLLGEGASRALGLYSQAFNLMMRPVYVVTTPLFSVMLPALSRALGNQRTYAELVARFYRLTAIALFPCGIGLWAVAPDLMLTLGGSQWQSGGLLLAALAPTILMQGFFNLSGCVFASRGQTGKLLAGSVVALLLLAQGLVAGYFFSQLLREPGAGAETAITSAFSMAIGYSVVSLGILLLPYLAYCFGSVGVSLSAVLRPLWPALRAAILMGLVVVSLRQLLLHVPALPAAARLVLLVATGAGTYLLLARRELHWFWQELRELRPAGKS